MSIARAKLITRASLLRDAAADNSLVSKPPQQLLWNEHARLVKCAMCISVFTALEEFVQARIKEVILKFQGVSPLSRGLPDMLRSALVMGAFQALSARVKESKRFGISDIHAFVVSQSAKIASYAAAGLDPYDLALATLNSNISWAIIENALSAFSVENPVSVFNSVARRIEGGIFVAKDHFESVSDWRNKAAHVADTDIPLGNVREYVEKLILFCAAFDIVLSTAASRVLGSAMLTAPQSTKGADIKLRFVERNNGLWRDVRESARRAFSRNVDLPTTQFSADNIARTNHECVVTRSDGSNSLSAIWSTPFL